MKRPTLPDNLHDLSTQTRLNLLCMFAGDSAARMNQIESENKQMLAALMTISEMKQQSPGPITYAARVVREIEAERKKNEE